MKAEAPVLSVVVPVFCEAEHLTASVGTIRDHAAALGVPYEIILVDDGSTDATWQRAEELVARWPQLVAISLARNFGKEAAIFAGLDAAEGDAVLVMDGDLQHPPRLIAELFALWRDGGHEVINAVKRRRQNESAVKRVLAKLYYRVFERLAGVELRGSSDFKLLDRRVVEVYRNMPERNLFFRGLARWMGFRQISVAFDVDERANGRSKWSVFKLLRLAVGSIVSFSTVPLQFVTFAGAAFLLVSVILGAHALYLKFAGGAVEGFTTVILLVLFASSLIMIALGIIGQYIAKIYEEVKRRPRYIVSRHARGSRAAEAGALPAADRRRIRQRVPDVYNFS